MPRCDDIGSVLIIGAGPIVIGQACEFDYSGAQACKALREEGLRVILVNSNPATIMTDPEMSDATYIEPIEWRTVARIIEAERPDAVLPTMGGQTALNCARDLHRRGALANVRLIGASMESIEKAEDRRLFDQTMKGIGLQTPRSRIVGDMDGAHAAAADLGYPCVVRPSFTLGGSGGGVAYNNDEFDTICRRGLALSPTSQLLIDESLLGWKEFEMEVVRDGADNCIIVCTIENLDPMGVHTGDSITVAPAQTLTDREYQAMRQAAIAVLRAIGVETGGANVQFAINPQDGRMVVIEMNPRVSRSSALASKATGFPIARVAAKLALGYRLDELQNEITGGATPASFEPSLDYVVTKCPRFAFEKFRSASDRLGTQMKSVGEVMALGRTFAESLQKALCSLETGDCGLDETDAADGASLQYELANPGPRRLWHVAQALRDGMDIDELHKLCAMDPWFLRQLADIVAAEQGLRGQKLSIGKGRMLRLKRLGFSDRRIAALMGCGEDALRRRRQALGVRPSYKRVDSCAAEFASRTAYMYSSYDGHCEAAPTGRRKVIILGGGPNRIGQGIEFDYCCVQAAQALRADGFEVIMVNCNPETVSTDYDISDRLYFEPVTLEHVLEIVHLEQPLGVLVQYGGQTPLGLARALEAAGVPILGTSPDAIDRAEDRGRCTRLIASLGLRQPPSATARTMPQALRQAQRLGYPLMVRPSYVLGGRAMETVYNDAELRQCAAAAHLGDDSPLLLDRFLESAIEVDIDAVCDGRQVLVSGIMEHIEQAGVHSGDSACSLPPHSLPQRAQSQMRTAVRRIARELGVVGLMNVQLAWQGGQVYVIEVNPRASRTVPFVSKALGLSLAAAAARCAAGSSLARQGLALRNTGGDFYAVKAPVFPFNKFPGVDPILGPEMKSTGESMGLGATFAEAWRKAQLAASRRIPHSGTAFLSVRDADKPEAVALGRRLLALGFDLVATRGTAAALRAASLPVQAINKAREGRPHIVDSIKSDKIQLIINTTEGRQAISDSATIRSSAEARGLYYSTTVAGGAALCAALQDGDGAPLVRTLQSLHKK